MASTAAVLCALVAGALAGSLQAGSRPMPASLQHPPPQPGHDRVTFDRAKVLGGAPPGARIWVGGAGGSPVDASGATLALPLESTVVIEAVGGPRREVRPDGPHYRMPYHIKQVREPAAGAGPEAAPTVVDAGEVDVFPVRSTLIWDGTRQVFFCTVRIALLADADRSLAPPVTLLLRTSADVVLPAQLDLASTNDYKEIELRDLGAHASVELFVMPVGRPDGAEEPSISLPLERPELQVTVNPKVLQGFGLQTAEVIAQPKTGLWPAASGAVLTFSAGDGSLDPGDVRAAEDEHARSRLRSSGLGADVVRVEGAPFAPGTYEVTYAFPTGFLCAALLGGVAGAIAAVRLRQKRSIRRRDLGTAAVTGLVAAVAYACGVNLVGIDLGNGAHEALVFTIGAVAALVGLPALKAKPAG
jgi:hypothetical protein